MAENKQLTPEEKIAGLQDELKKATTENKELTKINQELVAKISDMDKEGEVKTEKLPEIKVDGVTYQIIEKSFYLAAAEKVVSSDEIKSDKELQKLLVQMNSGFLKKK